jgi:hypothetical protein
MVSQRATVDGRRIEGNQVMDYWAKPGLDRQQAMLFYPTLDQSLSDDHPVRHLDEVLCIVLGATVRRTIEGRRIRNEEHARSFSF